MIIVDTSVWIEFFKQNSVYVSEVTLMLESKVIVTIEPIFSELLYGVRNEKEKMIILGYWKALPKLTFTDGTFIQSAQFAYSNNFQNLGIGLINSIIANITIENNCKLWTLDKKLNNFLDNEYLYKIE